jgi:pantothenate kinase
MEYLFNNNGIEIKATYSDEEINTVFIPLLEHLSEMRSRKGRRLIVMLAAPPGAGKSTLSSYLEYLSVDVISGMKVQAIGMDGFHRYQDYLISHTIDVAGRKIPMVDIKGAPVTFDIEQLKNKISEIASGKNCGWPVYNRLLHNPVDNAVFVDGDIIILEGNYLLLDEEGWRDLSDFADYTISIKADPAMLKERLIERKISTDCPEDDAVAFVEFSDMANVMLCLEKTKRADLELVLSKQSGYLNLPFPLAR